VGYSPTESPSHYCLPLLAPLRIKTKGVSLARNNFSFEKRQKELERKKKKEHKLQRKQDKIKSHASENSDQVRDEENPELNRI